MSLRDRFRQRQPADGEAEAAGPPGDGDQVVFRPRVDGSYLGGACDGISLRFTPSMVQESEGRDSAEGPATGEYTSSGRFVVQRPFDRPIVYTVLALTADGFVARRTDTRAGGGSAEVTFRFAPG